jgi:hypothetical protein
MQSSMLTTLLASNVRVNCLETMDWPIPSRDSMAQIIRILKTSRSGIRLKKRCKPADQTLLTQLGEQGHQRVRESIGLGCDMFESVYDRQCTQPRGRLRLLHRISPRQYLQHLAKGYEKSRVLHAVTHRGNKQVANSTQHVLAQPVTA